MGSGFDFSMALLRFLGFLVAITMYQAGIAVMARRRGDSSAETAVRATFNPLPHIEIFGTILFPFITILMNSPVVFGWPKPHTIDSRRFKKPKTDINLVYLSGVGINFAIGFVCMLILRFWGGGLLLASPSADLSDPTLLLRLMIAVIGLSNLTIGALYLLPFPGTAGWNILLNNIDYNKAVKLQEKAMVISLVGLALIVFGALNLYFNLFFYIFSVVSNTVISL